MSTVDIVVQGCDDATEITVNLTATKLAFLTEIAEKITAASETGCMPKMTVRPHLHDDDCKCRPVDADQARPCTCPNDGTGPTCPAHPECPLPCPGHHDNSEAIA
jgi:hypothetical protein